MCIKEEFKSSGLLDQLKNSEDYKIAQGYAMLLGEKKKFKWANVVWNRMIIPKHAFTLWLVIQNRIATTDRLKDYLNLTDIRCVLCGEHDENVGHLFFQCKCSNMWLTDLKSWLGWNLKSGSLTDLLRSIQRSKEPKFRKNVLLVTVSMLVYSIWQQRNSLIWRGMRKNDADIVQTIKNRLKFRFFVNDCKKVSKYDREWLIDL